jgi:hypothetical protein
MELIVHEFPIAALQRFGTDLHYLSVAGSDEENRGRDIRIIRTVPVCRMTQVVAVAFRNL